MLTVVIVALSSSSSALGRHGEFDHLGSSCSEQAPRLVTGKGPMLEVQQSLNATLFE